MRTHKSIYIERPVADVFWYVADMSRHGEWRSELLATDIVGEISEGVGAHIRQRIAYQGRTLEANLEITEFVPGQRICFWAHGGMHAHGCFDFTAKGTGTRFDASATMELKGVLGMMERYIEQAIDRVADADFERLKTVLERGA
ncbi:MAG: SRPBCC family protein [Coriobacteriia bacterium]|nr:SRPBCC family protein [Coriobacteriia bacterium]